MRHFCQAEARGMDFDAVSMDLCPLMHPLIGPRCLY